MIHTFYSHLVKIDFLYEELDALDLSEKEKEELKHHVHSSIHYVALDIVLSDLTLEHKKIFITHLNNKNHNELWKHLLLNSETIEDRLKEGILKTVHEFKEEINKLRKKA